MFNFPEAPAGSRISVHREFEQLRFSWLSRQLRPAGFFQLFVTAHLRFLLWISIGCIVIAIPGIQHRGNQLSFTILAVGAAGIAVGLPALFRRILPPGKTESVILSDNVFRHEPGALPSYVSKVRIRSFDVGSTVGDPFDNVFYRKDPIEVERDSLPPFVLEYVGVKQRLMFDRGDDRVEIGWVLSERDREWLYAVLEEWRTSRT